MASIIPKINIGLAGTKREKHNLSFDCSTTANIGSIQPTMCREMVPNSRFTVKTGSLVRLASMPLPTFGRMSLRHYHVFVPLVDLWQPFDALLSGQHYTGSNNTPFVPSKVPYFKISDLIPWINTYSDISIAPKNKAYQPYTITNNNVDWNGDVYLFGEGEEYDYSTYQEAVRAAQAADVERIETAWAAVRDQSKFGGAVSNGSLFLLGKGSLASDDKGVLNLGNFFAAITYQTSSLTISYEGVSQPNTQPYPAGNAVINAEGADLIEEIGDYIVYFKFKPFLKRLRTILIGLGFQFSPYNGQEMSVLKLLAYYKAWFNLFCPIRERSFVDTPCYWLIKRLSEVNGASIAGLENSTTDHWHQFVNELGSSCYYYLPMDYFSMSVLAPQASNQDTDFMLNSGAHKSVTSGTYEGNDATLDNVYSYKQSHSNGTVPNVSLETINGALSPLTLRLAQKMLTFANKNTVLGRSIRQYLKVHFGVDDVNAIDDGGVYRIGSTRTNIQISDVMSTAENTQGYLGEYGGKGIGYGDSEKFDFKADKFGYWLTLTAVVPESGYYQGYMKENRHLNRYQFFSPEFDALGYQVLERGEVMDDYNCNGAGWNPYSGYLRTYAFGLVPRYSEYKVGRNIVNGDLSLIGLYNSMSPYTLDRRIPGGALGGNTIDSDGNISKAVVQPKFVPSVIYDAFRRIDPTDHLGQYNRIFNYGGNDLDHFIIHNVFDVTCYAPMKSLSKSFDTVGENEPTIDVTHS